MYVSNFIMAVIMALLYLVFFYNLSKGIKMITKDKYHFIITVEITKTILWGLMLCTLLTLLHVTEFNFSDIFLCISLIIFYRIVGA